jgi:hypothetical protein
MHAAEGEAKNKSKDPITKNNNFAQKLGHPPTPPPGPTRIQISQSKFKIIGHAQGCFLIS